MGTKYNCMQLVVFMKSDETLKKIRNRSFSREINLSGVFLLFFEADILEAGPAGLQAG